MRASFINFLADNKLLSVDQSSIDGWKMKYTLNGLYVNFEPRKRRSLQNRFQHHKKNFHLDTDSFKLMFELMQFMFGKSIL